MLRRNQLECLLWTSIFRPVQDIKGSLPFLYNSVRYCLALPRSYRLLDNQLLDIPQNNNQINIINCFVEQCNSAIMRSAMMPTVVMPCVVMLSAIILNVVATIKVRQEPTQVHHRTSTPGLSSEACIIKLITPVINSVMQ